MDTLSILVGGKAGDGIREAGLTIARILSDIGYRVYQLYDYPSLIRGGHNFSIVRASREKVGAHRSMVDFILALSQDSVELHREMMRDGTVLIYDSDLVKAEGVGLPISTIVKKEKAPPIMRSSCLIGSFCRAVGVDWSVVEKVLKETIPSQLELNIKVASLGYGETKEILKVKALSRNQLPVLSGNEAIGLGLIRAGLEAYVAYPMTPASGVLHFCALLSDDFSLQVIHPENEIAVMLMALGFAYAGKRVAVGTSGGGFCLMNEGLSLAGMSELPVVAIVSQRPGPSTGVPTYTAQADLNFVLNAGHGEFPRLVVAPGDPDEAYFWSAVGLNLSWRWQIPTIVLVDKLLSEGMFSFDLDAVGKVPDSKPLIWNGEKPYRRYRDTKTGVSPLAFAPVREAVVKINSYEHDEFGITTELAPKIKDMQDKRLRKLSGLQTDLANYETVGLYGSRDATVALVCWGSNKWVCIEVARELGLRVVQPLVMYPFPEGKFREALDGVERVICVENNATAQLASHLKCHGLRVDNKILKYDGRSFSVDELRDAMERLVG